MNPEYVQRRAETEEDFAQASLVENSLESHLSPSGKYVLEITEYLRGPNTGTYSRGTVRRVDNHVQVADIKRNYGHFLHAWVQHPNGLEYLLCGEDYQGYNVICLDTGENQVHFPPEAFDGHGFCWASIHPAPDGLTLAIEGCYWAAPYELVLYDFSDPRALPFPELARIEGYWDVTGWTDNRTLEYTLGESKEERTPARWQRSS